MHELIRLRWLWQPLMIFPQAPQMAMAPTGGTTLTMPSPPPPIQQPVGSPQPANPRPTFLAGAAQVPPSQSRLANKTLLGQ